MTEEIDDFYIENAWNQPFKEAYHVCFFVPALRVTILEKMQQNPLPSNSFDSTTMMSNFVPVLTLAYRDTLSNVVLACTLK